MKYIELAGSPGSGKSTLIDYKWPPDSIKYDSSNHPKEWVEFLSYIKVCLKYMSNHPRYRIGQSLINRSIKKMITVHNMKSDAVYIQTGFIQRALGIWTRCTEKDRYTVTKKYLELCPTPLGVITLYADIPTIKLRNRTRNKQNRDFMVEDTEDCMNLVREIIDQRRIHRLNLDTRNDIKYNRNLIESFETVLKQDYTGA